MSLLSSAALVPVPGLNFTWRMNLPVPCSQSVGSRSGGAVKEPDVYVCSEYINGSAHLPNTRPDSRHAKAPGFPPLLGTATNAKKAPLPDPSYVYCTKILFVLIRTYATQRQYPMDLGRVR
jgi:hypothetical protein